MKERIKELRRILKLNQADFGSRVGVKGNTIGNYELGLRNPSEAVIFAYAGSLILTKPGSVLVRVKCLMTLAGKISL